MPLLGYHLKKIAILRANAIGDFVVGLPSFCALPAAYPQAEIVLLGNAWHQSFLAERPGPIDRLVVIPTTAGLSSAGDGSAADNDQQAAFFNAMRCEGFDLAELGRALCSGLRDLAKTLAIRQQLIVLRQKPG